MNEMASTAPTVLYLHDSGEVAVEGLRLDATGATWIDPVTSEAREALYSNIRSIRVTDRPRGTLRGLTVGSVLGGAFGVYGAVRADGNIGTLAPGVYVGVGTLVGGGIGILTGRTVGFRHTFNPK